MDPQLCSPSSPAYYFTVVCRTSEARQQNEISFENSSFSLRVGEIKWAFDGQRIKEHSHLAKDNNAAAAAFQLN